MYHLIPALDWYKAMYADRAETGMSAGQFQLGEMGLHLGEAVGLAFAGVDAIPGESAASGALNVSADSGGARSAINGLNLQKSLASEEQMGQEGTIIAGEGSGVAFRGASRAAEQFGGDATDWVKKSSTNFVAKDGTSFETHWVENTKTGRRFEYKTKFWP